MVPEELDQEDAVAVRRLNRGPGGVRLQLSGRGPELVHPPPDLVVLVSDDVDEGSVSSDRLFEGREEDFVLRREDRQEFFFEEAYRLIEEDLVLFARVPGRHPLVEGRLEFRELVDDIRVVCQESRERTVLR